MLAALLIALLGITGTRAHTHSPPSVLPIIVFGADVLSAQRCLALLVLGRMLRWGGRITDMKRQPHSETFFFFFKRFSCCCGGSAENFGVKHTFKLTKFKLTF